MRLRFAAVLACLLPLYTAPAVAQDNTALDCKVFDGQSWRSLGNTGMVACAQGVEQNVGQYNAQGFKFGMWGQTMLSADRLYFYRSPDGGKNWQSLGLQAELSMAAAPSAVMETPLGSSATSSDVVAAVREEAAPAVTAAPVREEPQPQTSVPAAAASRERAAVATAPSSASAATSMDRRSCSVGTRAGWDQLGILTLRECAEALDRTPDDLDATGFKYGYWSGLFLAASSDEVLSSSDARSWQPLLRRAGR